jgi:hypothetical protein
LAAGENKEAEENKEEDIPDTSSKFKLKMPADVKEPGFFQLLEQYLFWYYDGIAFFGFATYKLPRVLGKKPRYHDKIFSIKNCVVYGVWLYVLYQILSSQISKLGK